jgi:hypothetical protein
VFRSWKKSTLIAILVNMVHSSFQYLVTIFLLGYAVRQLGVQGCEGAVEVAFGARLQDVEHRQPKGMGRGLYLFNVSFDHRRIIDRVDEHGHGGRCGEQFVQHLEPFR